MTLRRITAKLRGRARCLPSSDRTGKLGANLSKKRAMTHTIRTLANPQRIQSRFLSRKWREEYDVATQASLLFDGDEFICETRLFPDGTERYIRLASGAAFERSKPRERWTCIGGNDFGKLIDEIEIVMEVADETAGPLFGCAYFNVIGFDVKYFSI